MLPFLLNAMMPPSRSKKICKLMIGSSYILASGVMIWINRAMAWCLVSINVSGSIGTSSEMKILTGPIWPRRTVKELEMSHHGMKCGTYVAQISFSAWNIAIPVIHTLRDSLHVFSILEKVPRFRPACVDGKVNVLRYGAEYQSVVNLASWKCTNIYCLMESHRGRLLLKNEVVHRV